jgi:hypothetical protein
VSGQVRTIADRLSRVEERSVVGREPEGHEILSVIGALGLPYE